MFPKVQDKVIGEFVTPRYAVVYDASAYARALNGYWTAHFATLHDAREDY